MAKFDLRGQKVNNQVIAETISTVNFGGIQNRDELSNELRKLISEINKATQEGIIVKDVSSEVKAYINKAIAEAEKPEPKKKAVIENIEGAKSLLDSLSSASNLVSALMAAVKVAGSIFL